MMLKLDLLTERRDREVTGYGYSLDDESDIDYSQDVLISIIFSQIIIIIRIDQLISLKWGSLCLDHLTHQTRWEETHRWDLEVKAIDQYLEIETSQIGTMTHALGVEDIRRVFCGVDLYRVCLDSQEESLMTLRWW